MALTTKRKAFIEHYLQCWNASKAARLAGYSEKTAAQQASRLLTNVNVLEAIEERKQELMMGADEALILLTEHARGDMGDFMSLTSEGPVLDLTGAVAQGYTRLIRKLKTKRRTYVEKGSGDDDDTVVTEIDAEIELYNAQSALELIGKSHKLFTDKDKPDGSQDKPLHIRYIQEARPNGDDD